MVFSVSELREIAPRLARRHGSHEQCTTRAQHGPWECAMDAGSKGWLDHLEPPDASVRRATTYPGRVSADGPRSGVRRVPHVADNVSRGAIVREAHYRLARLP